jgi:hypothetical protein
MSRQRALLTIGSFIFFGCGMLPEKPKVELCTLDVPAQEAICGTTGGASDEQMKLVPKMNAAAAFGVMTYKSSIERKPITYVDKGVALRPDEWVKARNYIDSLERYIELNCR